jgi:hypothetical protein
MGNFKNQENLNRILSFWSRWTGCGMKPYCTLSYLSSERMAISPALFITIDMIH